MLLEAYAGQFGSDNSTQQPGAKHPKDFNNLSSYISKIDGEYLVTNSQQQNSQLVVDGVSQ